MALIPPIPKPSAARPPRIIARRMAVGFGLVSIVAVLMAGVLIGLLHQVSGHVDEMRGDEAAIKESLALAISVREQYIHQAHWLIERKEVHLSHYGEWVQRVRGGVDALRPLVPEHRTALEGVARDSAELDELFRQEMMPAARAGYNERVAWLHAQAGEIAQGATEAADEIARAVEQRMAMAHRSATRATTLGLVSGAVGVALVLALSIMFTLRLRRSVLTPLSVLSRAARRFGAGEFQSRVGRIGEGELRAVSDAFDTMATELEKRENKLIAAERMAAIGQLAAGVAHEINNPIQVIRGYLKTMIPDASRDNLREELLILDEEAAACQRIAEDLVAYSRSQGLQYQSVVMDEFLREAARRFGETPEGQKHEVNVRAANALVQVDPARLRQVLLNLLVNAAQVSERGEPIAIEGREQSNGGYAIDVIDRGPGIEVADRARVFEPFYSKRSGGSGLGLAVSQGIVRAHGGSIEVEDDEGGGSAFRIRLPGKRAPARSHS